MPKNEENSRHWSSRSVGAPWQHRFFYGLIRLGGRRAAGGRAAGFPLLAFLTLVAWGGILSFTLLCFGSFRSGMTGFAPEEEDPPPTRGATGP